ncbi:hypothetical protein Tco_1530987 [Tanacetum coccineum]
MNNALNNEAVKDGVVPSDTVASGINNTQDENLGQYPSTGPTASASHPASVSFETPLKGESSRNLNFRTLITQAGNGDDVVVMLESIRVVSERYANSAYGFFLGKRVVYPVVANYGVGVATSELFAPRRNQMDGLDSMLENGS